MRDVELLAAFDEVVGNCVGEIVAVGSLRYSRTPVGQPEQRRSLGISTAQADFELLVWETGDAEFGYGVAGDNRDEHLLVRTRADLEAQVLRLIRAARDWPARV